MPRVHAAPVHGPNHRRPRRRRRIGLLLDRLSYTYQREVLQGVHDELARRDVDLCCFMGGHLSETPYTGRSSIYELASRELLDGLIVGTSTLANVVGPAGVQSFVRRFEGIPICSIGVALEGIPSILIDNFTGVKDLTAHLLEVHKRTRIAVVTGPSMNAESQQRLAGYRAALAAHHLASSPELVVVGDFTHRSGLDAVKRLVDEGTGCDAIVAANDWMAKGVLEALDKSGIRVPREVAVVGFDDIDEARFTAPSLTTIRQPIHELGRQAARSILMRLQGEEVPLTVTLPTSLCLRHSCGCFAGSASRPAVRHDHSISGVNGLAHDHEELSRLVAPDMPEGGDTGGGERVRAGRLLTALRSDLAQETDDQLLATLGKMLDTSASWGNVHAWHGTLTSLRVRVNDYLGRESAEALRLDRIVEQAHIAVSAAAERSQGRRRLEQEGLLRRLQQTSTALLAAVDLPSLSHALAEGLPSVRIPSCTVALRQQQRSFASGSALLVIAYEGGLLLDGPREVSGDEVLLPSVMPDRRRSTVLQPLVAGTDVVGFCSLELGLPDGAVYEVLCEQVSGAVKGVQLFRAVVEEITKREQAERARLEDEMRMATRIQTGILPKTTSVSGLEIAAIMLPATEVGGDYFDVLPFEGGCWLGIGDVAGHGLPTGVVMLMIQSIVAATTRCRPDASASEVWAATNNILYDNLKRLEQDEYATLSIIRYESSGDFTVAGAHEEIVLYRAATGQCETVPLVGTWAGLRTATAGGFEEASDTLLPGDLLVLYTDGVIEAMNEAKQQFGLERVCRLVEAVGTRPVVEIRDHLIAAVKAWSAAQFDDISLVVIRQGVREG